MIWRAIFFLYLGHAAAGCFASDENVPTPNRTSNAGCSESAPCDDGFFCDDDECREVLSSGEMCSFSDQCISGSCVGGVCCSSVCNGACRSCSGSQTGRTDGLCALVLAGTDPNSSCQSGFTCDGFGECAGDDPECEDPGDCASGICESGECVTRAQGSACSDDDECMSGFCTDGVCCDEVCDGTCESCLGAISDGTDGQCKAIPAGEERTEVGFEDCPGVQNCDGSGGCFAKSTGTSCSGDNECASGFCADGVCCNQRCNGICRNCATGACVAVTTGADPGTCNACFADGTCSGKGIGEICASAAECGSGVCEQAPGDSARRCKLKLNASCESTKFPTDCVSACINGTCRNLSAAKGDCDDTNDCIADSTDLACIDGKCRKANGSCILNDECQGSCIGGNCSERSGVGANCDSDDSDDCEAGLVCTDTTCLIPVGSSLQCAENSDCQEPACIDGDCSFWASRGQSCDDSADCFDGSDNVCLDSKCVDSTGIECTGDGDCAGARTCSDDMIDGLRFCQNPGEHVDVSLLMVNFYPGVRMRGEMRCRTSNGITRSVSAIELTGGRNPNRTIQSETIKCEKGGVIDVECSVLESDESSLSMAYNLPASFGTSVGWHSKESTLSGGGELRAFKIEREGVAHCVSELD